MTDLKHVNVIIVCRGRTVFESLFEEEHELSSEYSMLDFYFHGVLLNCSTT